MLVMVMTMLTTMVGVTSLAWSWSSSAPRMLPLPRIRGHCTAQVRETDFGIVVVGVVDCGGV